MYCIECNRSEEEFWKSSLDKVLYIINTHTDNLIDERNFYIALFKSIGGEVDYIDKKEIEQEEMCTRFRDFMC